MSPVLHGRRFFQQRNGDTRVARWYIFMQKIQFGYILEGRGMGNVGIFNCKVEQFTAVWYILMAIW
jgi:hypothetical protein